MEDGEDIIIKVPHYYGDIVRSLFLGAAAVMLLGSPIVAEYTNVPTMIAITTALVLAITAGLTNPKKVWDAWINVLVAGSGFVVFGAYTVGSYQIYGLRDKFFIANLVLGFIFLFAVYFSVKTLRGLLIKDEDLISKYRSVE